MKSMSDRIKRVLIRTSVVCLLVLAEVGATQAQTPASTASAKTAARTAANTVAAAKTAAPWTTQERAAVRAFERAEVSPRELRAFLARMPKGADLHLHLAGAVYAETFLREAAEDLLCVDPVRHTFVHNAGTTRSFPPHAVCKENQVSAEELPKDAKLYAAMIDAFSMRSFVPSAGMSAHDHFFESFDLADPYHDAADRHGVEWLDEVLTRAAADRVQYVEVMQSPSLQPVAAIAGTVAWLASADDPTGTAPATLSALRDRLLAGPLKDRIAQQSAEYDQLLAGTREHEQCKARQPAAACAVTARFIYYVLREGAPERVFTQALAAFEVAVHNPLVVGVNLVQPEDGFLSMAEYSRQMRMLDYLHSVYPQVNIALHAGELAEGLVPPEGLRSHIREAVEIGHAERIGHGISVMYETDAAGLLHEMAERHTMVEINLTSNELILGIAGTEHPLASYIAAGVPVALSTDDEGVSRIDMTHEWVAAVIDQHMRYPELKAMARTSLEHSFLPGASLWAAPDVFSKRVSACAGQPADSEPVQDACAAFLKSSERARQQWELERRYAVFEREVAAGR